MIRRRAGDRRILAAAAAVAVVAVAIGAFVAWPRSAPVPGPDLSGVPEAALVPDLPALSPDGQVRDADLAHDSRADAYRQPFGAVPAGTEVTLRLRAAAGDLEEADDPRVGRARRVTGPGSDVGCGAGRDGR